LAGNIEPEGTVLQNWKGTWLIRKKLLREDGIPVSDYFRKYPCLSLQIGVNLVSFFKKVSQSSFVKLYSKVHLYKRKFNSTSDLLEKIVRNSRINFIGKRV